MKLSIKFFGGSFKKIHFSWRYVMAGVSLLIFVVFLFVLQFIYKNVFSAFSSTQEIVVLRTEVVSEVYNIGEFQNVISTLEEKIAETDDIVWENIKNPFGTFVQTSQQAPAPPESAESLQQPQVR